MARRRTEAVIPTTSMVASAVRYPGKAARIYQPTQDWQSECYRHYGICGEARFAANFFGHALSRATLTAGKKKDGEVIADTGPAADALSELFNGRDGQAQMLKAIGLHLTIAGECFLVGRTVGADEQGEGGEELWEIVSVLEMRVNGQQWSIHYGDGMQDVKLTENDVVIRIWVPNPAKRIEADSPFRSLLPILSEIEWLTRHIFAQITSRLAGAGILFLPQGMTFPPPPEGENAPEVTNEASGMMLTLGPAMMQPIQDPSSPAATIPVVATVPDGTSDQVKHLTFWSELDEHSLELRTEAIRRFALGMDLEPEQVLGMGSNSGTGGGTSNGVSHWGAWQIEESTIKMHIEPMLETVTNALVIGYIRPATEDPADVITYSTAALRLRPDRSKEAMEMFDRGLLSPEVLFKENGFNPDDMMDDAQRKQWLLMKVASGSATPEQVAAALKELGVDLGVIGTNPRDAQPAPTIDEHPTRPRTPQESAGLLFACDALVYRALERVGNRLRNAGVKPPCRAHETHEYVNARGREKALLDDAWSCAPEVLEGIADPEEVVPVLDAYATSLLATKGKHSRAALATWLEKR